MLLPRILGGLTSSVDLKDNNLDFLAVLSLISLSKILEKKQAEIGKYAYPILFSFLILFQLLFSLVSALHIINSLFFFTGMACWGLIFYKFVKKEKYVTWHISDGVFILFALFFKFFTLNGEVHGGDPFFWATLTKYLAQHGAIWQPIDNLIASEYLPGIPLFQSFFYWPNKFSESTLFFSNGIFIFGYLMPFIFDVKNLKRDYLKLFSMLFVFVLSLAMFGQGWVSLLTDHLIGVTWAVSILYCLYVKISLKTSLYFSVLLLSSLFVRESGMTMAITLGMTWSFRCLLEKKNLLFSLPALCSPWIIYIIWKQFLSIVKMPYTDEGIHFSEVGKDFLNFSPTVPTLRKFEALWKAMSEVRVHKLISNSFLSYPEKISAMIPWVGGFYFWIALLGLTVGAILFKKSKKRAISWGVILLIGSIGWIACHMILWIYVQPCGETGFCEVFAYDRYMQSFILGIALVAGHFWSQSLGKLNRKNIAISLLIISFSILQFPPLGNTLRTPMGLSKRTTYAERRLFEKTISDLDFSKLTESRIALVFKPESFSVDLGFIRYMLYPSTKIQHIKLSDKNSIDAFINLLSNFDHLLIINNWDKYKSQFPELLRLNIDSNGLYKLRDGLPIKKL